MTVERSIADFYREAACNETHGIAVAILSVSVRPSVHLFDRRMYCDKTKRCAADILIPYETTITLSLLTPTVVGGRWPLPSEICAQSDPPSSKNAYFDRFPLITSQP